MQGHRFVAAVVLLTLVALGATLPLATIGHAALGVLALAGVAYVALGERALAVEGRAPSRSAIASRIARRAHGATPEQRTRIAEMEADLREAASHLAGREALPWYLVLGLPQSGKSSLLASSGQAFSYATPTGGARGDRNCRWWITPQCAWIDAGGSYLLGDGDEPEWLILLRDLATIRPAQTLQGVVVTLAADSIAAARPADVDAAAQRVRERLDEALTYLGVDVPVYVMVTRCDLLPGFSGFFADLREAERGQVWGCTWATSVTPPIGERFTRAFDELLSTLVQRSLRRMGAREPADARTSHYQFPQWFAAVRSNLLRFATSLFASSLASPGARGLYFSSASEATTLVRGDLVPTGTRGYFLRDWISHIVLPDRELATPSALSTRSRLARRNALAALLCAASVLVATLGGWSWHENHLSLNRFDDAFTAALARRPPVDAAALEQLRDAVDHLRDRARDDAPTWSRLGMRVAPDVAPRASLAFAVLVFRDVAGPVAERLHRDLAAQRDRTAPGVPGSSARERARSADQLRLYLLLTSPRGAGDPQPGDPAQLEWLATRLAGEWEALSPAASPVERAARTRQARLYGEVLAVEPRIGAPRDLALVSGVRALFAR